MGDHEYELRTDAEGRIWKHSINRKGRVLEACSRVSDRETADAMVVSGEARWRAEPKARPSRDASAPRFGATYEQEIQRLADEGVPLSPKDWDAAMNRDD